MTFPDDWPGTDPTDNKVDLASLLFCLHISCCYELIVPTSVIISQRTRILQLSCHYISEKGQLNGEIMPTSTEDLDSISCVVLDIFYPLFDKDIKFAAI